MYTDILIPVDPSQESSWKKALPTAVGYAKAFGARLHVMTVVPDFGMTIVAQYFPEDFESKALQDANVHLHEFVKKHVPEEIAVQHIVAHGRIYEEIMKTARTINADLIIMAAHRLGLSGYLIGANADRVMRHADRSVLVVRD
jgi:nucleotide-binding universal stress UspA family protein